jgi:integrase
MHRPTGQAVVTVRDPATGRRSDHYLGEYGSQESHARYAQLVHGQPPAAGRGADEPVGRNLQRVEAGVMPPTTDLSVGAFYERFMEHARAYYVLPSGEPSKEVEAFRLSFREFLELHRDRSVASIGEADLRSSRKRMIEGGLSRGVINQRVARVARAFSWGASGEDFFGVGVRLVPQEVAAVLRAVQPLKKDRSAAPEHEPVKPVPREVVEKTLRELNPTVADMVWLMLSTGMRPGEVCMLSSSMLDRSGELWIVDYGNRHKMAYKGAARKVILGKKARAILEPWLLVADETPHLAVFRPSSCRTPGRRSSKDRYDVTTLNRAIARAAARAGVEHWSANQLRHLFATEVREAYGLDAAQVLLGHAKADVTQVYADATMRSALDVVRRLDGAAGSRQLR